MQLLVLTKEKTYELEKHTLPIQNLFLDNRLSKLRKMEKIQQWYRYHQLAANQNQKDFIKSLSLLFKAAPYPLLF